MAATIIPISNIADDRLADYRDIKDQQQKSHFLEGDSTSADPRGHGLFYVEGRVVLHYLVRSTYITKSVLASPTQIQACSDDLALLPDGTPVYEVPPDAIEQIAGFDMHRGLMAVAYRKPLVPWREALGAFASHEAGGSDTRRFAPVVLVLEDLSNHDNLGGLFRNAAALGCRGVMLSPRCCDPLYRRALRVAVGTTLVLPWARCESIQELLSAAHEQGFASAGMTPRGEFTLQTLSAALRNKPTLVLIGAEGPGLTDETLAACAHSCRIPMAAGIDSLSAATSGALALYSFIEHRRSWDCATPR
jgi:tRNA G18 (ribose-2'-O)-methylase SpoU